MKQIEKFKQIYAQAGIAPEKHEKLIKEIIPTVVDSIFSTIEQEIKAGKDGGRPYSYYASRLQAEGLTAPAAHFKQLAKKYEEVK